MFSAECNYNDQVKEDEVDRGMHIGFWWESQKEKTPLEDMCVGGRIILWRAAVMQWTVFYWRHIHGNEYGRKPANDTQRLGKELLPRQPICVSTETNPEQRISELWRLVSSIESA
jgi:hypothetical protein